MTKLTRANLVHLRATYPEHRLPDGGAVERPLPRRNASWLRRRRQGSRPDAA